jgi:hypothetical protein
MTLTVAKLANVRNRAVKKRIHAESALACQPILSKMTARPSQPISRRRPNTRSNASPSP